MLLRTLKPDGMAKRAERRLLDSGCNVPRVNQLNEN